MSPTTAPRGISNKPNYWYSIIGVALVLFLVGFFGVIILQGQQLVRHLQENVTVLVELKPQTTPAQISLFTQVLHQGAYTKPNSVKFTSKEEAIKVLENDIGKEFTELGFSNPLYDSFTFNVRSDYSNAEQLKLIRSKLRETPFVNDVIYPEGHVDSIAQNIEKIGYFSLIVGILFIFVAIVLIHNTIKLALYANRFLIKNMQLIGASWGLISRPYLLRSLKNGLWSAFIAIAMLAGLIFFVANEYFLLQDNLMIFVLFGSLIILGILITSLSTYYIVNKYLRMRIDDMY